MKSTSRVTSERVLKFRTEKKKQFRVRLYFAVFLSFTFLGLVLFLLHLSFWNIKTIHITGTSLLRPEIVEKYTQDVLARRVGLIFSRANFFFLNPHVLENELSDQFSRIKTVHVKRESLSKLLVTVEERSISYLWCGDTPGDLSNKSEQCYFLDTQGTLFGVAPYFSGPVHFVIFGRSVHSSEDIKLGLQVFSEKDMQDIIVIKDGLDKDNVPSYGLFVNGDESFVLLSQELSTSNEVVRFNKHVPYIQALENLHIALTNSDLKSYVKEHGFKGLSYIDLRFINKVYYKEKPLSSSQKEIDRDALPLSE